MRNFRLPKNLMVDVWIDNHFNKFFEKGSAPVKDSWSRCSLMDDTLTNLKWALPLRGPVDDERLSSLTWVSRAWKRRNTRDPLTPGQEWRRIRVPFFGPGGASCCLRKEHDDGLVVGVPIVCLRKGTLRRTTTCLQSALALSCP